MNIQVKEGKEGSGLNTKASHIGRWKGSLVAVNPDVKQLQELGIEGENEPIYKITTKEEKELPCLQFWFKDELTGIMVPYTIFIEKEPAEFEKDGVTKAWYINQWGATQCVADKKDLFRSFTHMQKYNNDEKVWEDVLDDGNPIELMWRKAWSGETALYGLLRRLVNQDWFKADQSTNLFIAIDPLLKGKVNELRTWIGTDNYQPVVGMIDVATEDKDGKTFYNQNCVHGAWMPGYRYAESNIITKNDQWGKYEEKASSKGKGQKDFYEFYQAVKRNKNTVDWNSIHVFNPDDNIATSNRTIDHSKESSDEQPTMDYDGTGLR